MCAVRKAGGAVALDDNDAVLQVRVVEVAGTSVECSACELPSTRLIEAVHDPVLRSRAATEAITAAAELIADLSRIRRAAVAQLRERDMTQREVADALGISQARVAQIEHGNG